MEATNEEEELQQNLLKESLQQQLDEFQMLSAIFCNAGELEVDDYGCIVNLTSFTNGENVNLNTKLDYRLNLRRTNGEKVELLIELPHLYPSLELPRIVVRSAAIQRDQERLLMVRIEEYINTEVIDHDQPYMYQVINWLQENLDELLKATMDKRNQLTVSSSVKDKPTTEDPPIMFERLWIYSHHLKSKAKRQTIVKTARDLDLCGFSRPGKPAIICVEGYQSDTKEFWRIVKSLKWQKIQIKLSETSPINATMDLTPLRHFPTGFREELFCEMADDDSNVDNLPMSMSLFMKFLEKHNCGYIKKEIFGLQNANDTPTTTS